MKPQILIFIIVLLAFSCSDRDRKTINREENTGPTEISGSVSGILSTNASPYHIKGDLLVDSTSALVIEPGVKLLFSDSCELIIRGELQAIGDSAQFIHFSSLGSIWQGIKIESANRASKIAFSYIENVRHDTDEGLETAALTINESEVVISNSFFRNNFTNDGGGIIAKSSTLSITNSIFTANTAVVYGGGVLAVGSTVEVINNTFYNNICINYGGGLVLIEPVLADVQNNIFFQNNGGTGDPRIALASGDSSVCHFKYNFLWYGDLNPRFAGETDFHLSANSPCIDAGNPDTMFIDVDGSRNDQGAYGGKMGGF